MHPGETDPHSSAHRPSDFDADARPSPSPLQRYGVIETDRFCRKCGYNLHGLNVERDARLDLLIIRCPECGTFDAAGQATTVNSLWLSRLGTVGVLAWIVVLLWLVGVLGIGTFAMSASFGDVLVPYDRASLRWVGGEEFEPVPRVHWTENTGTNIAILAVATAVAGLIAGVFLATCFWHWRKRYLLVAAAILPLVALAVLLCEPMVNSPYPVTLQEEWDKLRLERGQWVILAPDAPLYDAAYLGVRLSFALFQSLVLLVAVAIGRPIARGLLRLLLPPRLRQSLVFLWRVDGKDLTMTNPTKAPS